jgi:internalin A
MQRSSSLHLITRACEEQWEKLNLSGMYLSELPLEIGQLINLKSLCLSNNKLKTLPESISKLTKLTYLGVRCNQLSILPESVSQLTNLKSLHLSNNKFKDLPESIGQLSKLTSLDLSNNKINFLPKSIIQLTSLTLLDLSSNQLNSLPESSWKSTKLSALLKLIGQLSKLTSFDLSNNKLNTLPEIIGQLNKLTFLNLRNNQLSALPETIGQLTSIASIDISNNELNALPESIGQLTKLISLDLSNNKLNSLPESIINLTDLTSINLSSNQIDTLPDSISQLTSLTSLNLSNNKLKFLPKTINQLSNIVAIDLSNNQLNSLPESIDQLASIMSLDLSDNQLSVLPKAISKLSNLTSLDLKSNQLNILPKLIGELSNLSFLDLRSNQLKALPDSVGQLINIRSLRLSNNQLNDLPELIGQLFNITFLELSNNPLSQIPPEIVMKSGLAVRDYYRQRLEEKTAYIYEAKLLVIGEGGAGKTSLANKLINFDYKLKLEGSDNPEKSTEGIDVLRLDFPHSSGNSFRINIWDFGGQEIYHATHQFFLTKRSLYLLLVDTRQDNTDFNYWLEVVELLSEASPSIIIKNEKQDRPCQVNENQLRGRFSNLEKILPTNLSSNRGLSEILTAVQHHISQLPHIGQPLPKTWVRVREALEADKHNYITQSEFLDLCDTHGFKRREDKLQLSGYLHDLGVCLHFQDDPILKNWIILKPEWGTTAVYTVLDTPEIQQALGFFTHKDLAKIWADEQYTDMRDELLQLMMRFKLCYEIPHRPYTYIAPQLLSPNQPEYTWDNTDNLILRYHYDFMPKGMLTRFTVEMHRLIDSDLVWKEGVILTDSNARATVIETYSKNEIRVRVSGFPKKDLLTRIRHEFDKIHDSYEKLRYQELIPCNCPTCKGSQNPHAYVLKKLQERLENEAYETECDQKPYHKVNVHSLIDDAIGHNQVTTRDNQEGYSREAYEDMREIAKIAAGSTKFNIGKDYIAGDNVMGDKIAGDKVMGDKDTIAGNKMKTGDVAGDAIAGNKIVNSQNLAQAAQEIKELLDRITATDQTNNFTLIAVKAIEAIEKNPTLKDRIINAGKEAGFAAIDAAVDHPAVKIVTAAIKGAIEA